MGHLETIAICKSILISSNWVTRKVTLKKAYTQKRWQMADNMDHDEFRTHVFIAALMTAAFPAGIPIPSLMVAGFEHCLYWVWDYDDDSIRPLQLQSWSSHKPTFYWRFHGTSPCNLYVELVNSWKEQRHKRWPLSVHRLSGTRLYFISNG